MDSLRPETAVVSLVQELSRRMRAWEGALRAQRGAAVSSGSPALDRLLPEGGLARGSLVEWFSAGAACGACTLALLAAREAGRAGGAIVILDRRGTFYAPAAASLGVPLDRLLVVRTPRAQDEVWAMDQALRTAGVAAVLAWPDGWSNRALRRVQLAAEAGAGLGLLVRRFSGRSEPSWADVRLSVEPQALWLPETRNVRPLRAALAARRKLRVELARCRRGTPGASVVLKIDGWSGQTFAGDEHETGSLPVAAELAAATTGRRSRRA